MNEKIKFSGRHRCDARRRLAADQMLCCPRTISELPGAPVLQCIVQSVRCSGRCETLIVSFPDGALKISRTELAMVFNNLFFRFLYQSALSLSSPRTSTSRQE